MEAIVIRTQIQLEEAQARHLKAIAAEEGRSMADVIREAVRAFLRGRHRPDRSELMERAWSVIGSLSSGLGDLAENHDKYLDEAYGA